jgi:hypothetical protein
MTLHGHTLPLSNFRRLVTDCMHFSRKVPAVTIERPMNLSAVDEAREACWPRPRWTAIFVKAFGLVASRRPELRRSYLSFPWPRLYEHPFSIGTCNIEREIGGEKVVIFALIPRPEETPLLEIDARVRYFQETPLDQIATVNHARLLARIPWPFRRLIWWSGLNVMGSQRCRHFGTFGTTSLAAQGAGVVQVIPLLTATFFYSLFDDDSNLIMRLAIDHRVLDGVVAARALSEMEEVLNNEILKELKALARPQPSNQYEAPVVGSPLSS